MSDSSQELASADGDLHNSHQIRIVLIRFPIPAVSGPSDLLI